MTWARQQIIIIKKHFCDVKICPAAIYSATTWAFLYSVLTTKAWVNTRHGKGKQIIQWIFYFSNFGFTWSERATNWDLIYIGGTCINLLNFVVSCRVLRITRQRDPWQHAASLPQQEQAPPEEDLFLCFFRIFSGFSSGFLFYFVRRQLKRKVGEKISYMSPGHSSWPGYNRELLLGRRRPPTKKDI